MTLFVKGLSLSYGRTEILRDISFSLPAGCRAALSDLDPFEAEASALSSYMRILFCSNEFGYID